MRQYCRQDYLHATTLHPDNGNGYDKVRAGRQIKVWYEAVFNLDVSGGKVPPQDRVFPPEKYTRGKIFLETLVTTPLENCWKTLVTPPLTPIISNTQHSPRSPPSFSNQH